MLKSLVKWLIGILFLFLGGVFLLPPVNNLINSRLSHIKLVEKTNDWGRFFIAFVVSIFLINTFVPAPPVQNVDTKASTTAVISNESEKYLNNKNTKKLLKELKTSREQSASIYNVLAECGVRDIEYIEKMDGNDVRGYFIHISNANNPVRLALTANNTVDVIIYDTWVLYEDGKVKDNLNNYAISAQDLLELRALSLQEVRKYLNHPETAKFKGDWNATKLGNDFILSSTVKYKNDFAQELECPFSTQFRKTNNNFKPTFLSIDKEIVFKENVPQKQLTQKDKAEVREIERLMGL